MLRSLTRASYFANARALADEHFERLAELTSIPSISGKQLEAARLDLSDIHASFYDCDDKQVRFVETSRLMRDLTEIEYRVLAYRHCAIANHQTYSRTVNNYELHPLLVPLGDMGGECNAPTLAGGMCKRRRYPGLPRCRTHEHLASAPATWVTRSGEEFVNRSEQNDEMSVVAGTRTNTLSDTDIAEQLGLRPYQVRTLAASAYSKIRANIEASGGESDAA